MNQKIPFQILNNQLLALFPDGEVEFVNIKLKDKIEAYNKGIIETLEYKDHILSDVVFENGKFYTTAPLIAFIEVTNLCNLTCKHCYASSQYRRQHEMPTPMILKLLDQLNDMGVLQVFLSGGEIFTHKDAVEIINYASKKKFTTQVFTNGIFLTEEIVSKLPKNIGFAISFDTADPVRTVRGKMNYPKLKYTFELLNKFGLAFRTAVSVHKNNINDVEEIYDWCIEHNYPRPQWLETFATGRALKNKDILLNAEDFEKVFEVYKKCMNKYCFIDSAKKTGVENKEKVHSIKTIQMVERLEIAMNRPKLGNTMVYINSSGDVYPDSSCLDFEEFIGGSLYKKTFAQIWNESFGEIRKYRFEDFKGCSKCEIHLSGIHCNFRDYGLSKNLYDDFLFCGASSYTKLMILNSEEYWNEKNKNGYKLKLLI